MLLGCFSQLVQPPIHLRGSTRQRFGHLIGQRRHQILFFSSYRFQLRPVFLINLNGSQGRNVCCVHFKSFVDSVFVRTQNYAARYSACWYESGAGIHFSRFSAPAAVPHLSQWASRALRCLAVTLLPVRKTPLKANSSFILEIMKKSVRKRLEWKLQREWWVFKGCFMCLERTEPALLNYYQENEGANTWLDIQHRNQMGQICRLL